MVDFSIIGVASVDSALLYYQDISYIFFLYLSVDSVESTLGVIERSRCNFQKRNRD